MGRGGFNMRLVKSGVLHTEDMLDVRLQEVPFADEAVARLLAEWDNELGFSPKGGSTVQASDFAPPNGIFLLALIGDDDVGCAGLRRLTSRIAEVKRLFVRPAARGRGTARALLAGLEECAQNLGFEELRLDADGGAPAALALFRAAGFTPIDDYNGNPYARYWFAKRVTAQHDA
jgi:GNAT superfamily N-acetyltransferase